MRHLLFTLLLFFLAASLLAQEQLIRVSEEEILLEDLMRQLETSYGLLFSYRQEDVEGLKVSPAKKPLPLRIFFDELLRTTELSFEVVDAKFVLLTKLKKEEVSTTTPPEETFLKLCGTVLDSLTGEPLPAANIYTRNGLRGTTSSNNGSFKLEIPLAEKNDSIIISYVGYQEQRLPTRALIGKSCPDILLNYYSFGDDFLIVTEYLTDGILSGNNGAFTQLQPDKMGTLPGQLEPDVLNTIQFLPGVSSMDGSPAGIGVQGGTPDQNLILWEDIPLYHTAHYFGSLTAINPYVIDKVSVYTGGFGAEYGGRISGVIELESEVDEQAGNTLGIGTNLIHTFADGQLKSKDERLSAVYSLRQSTTGIWRSPNFRNISKRVQQGILVQNVDLNRLPEDIEINDKLSFFDSHLKLEYRLSEKDAFSAAGFYAQNDFEDVITDDRRRQTQADTFSLLASGIQLGWQHEWSAAWQTRLLALHTGYEYDYGYSILNQGQPGPSKIGEKQSSIQEQQIHLITDYQTTREHQLKIGYQSIHYDVTFDVSRNQQNDGTGRRDFLSNLHVLYASLKTNPSKKVGTEIGLRLNHYEEISQQYLAPRLRLWYQPNDNLNLYLSGGKYFQYLSQLIQFKGDDASIETPVWGLSGAADVPVLDANHLQWGMILRPEKWLIDVQAYLKKVKGISSLASGFDEGLSNRFHIGEANIQGVSLLVKKRWQHYKSWLSYAWSNIDHHFPTFFDQEFTATIEQRHRLRWAHMWTYGSFEFSLGWNISTGRPYSKRSNFMLMPSPMGMGPPEIVVPIENEFNSSRLPTEHQLDASVLYTISSPDIKKSRGMVGVSLFNIYHQRNIYNRELFIDARPNMLSRLAYNNSVNMGFTPSFLLRLHW